MESVKKTKGKMKIIIGLCVIALFMSFAGMTNSLIANIAVSYSSYPYTTVAQIMTIPTLVGMFASFAVGPIAQKVSKKLLLIVNCAILVVYSLTFALVGGNGPIFLLLAVAAIVGVVGGTVMTLISGIINDFFDATESGKYIALLTSMLQGGTAVLTLFGGFIAAGNDGADWPLAYYLELLVIPAAIIFWLLVPGEKKKSDSFAGEGSSGAKEKSQTAKEKIPTRVWLMILAKLLFTLCMAGFVYYYATYVITEYSLGTSAETGTLGTVYMASGMIAGFTFGLWQKIFKKAILPIAYALLIIAMIIMMFSTESLAGVFVAGVLVGVGSNWGTSCMVAKIMEESPSSRTMIATSICMGVVNITAYFSTYILGFFGGLFGEGLEGIFITAAIFGVAALVLAIYIAFGKKSEKAAECVQDA